MMLSGPSPGTEHYKEATLFISRVLDEASISPRSMESLAINRGEQEERERVIDRENERQRGRMMQREREEERKTDGKARDGRQSECLERGREHIYLVSSQSTSGLSAFKGHYRGNSDTTRMLHMPFCKYNSLKCSSAT